MGADHHGPAKGITRWFFTTNHKDIGTMYLWFSFAMFILGGAMSLILRAVPHLHPGHHLLSELHARDADDLRLGVPHEVAEVAPRQLARDRARHRRGDGDREGR